MGDPNTGEIYEGVLRSEGDVALDRQQAEWLKSLPVRDRVAELKEMQEKLRHGEKPTDAPSAVRAEAAAKPDLRTLEGALSFLDYHAPNDDTLPRHQTVNTAFQELASTVWNAVPDGPGKTVALRAIGRARMECNSAIANGGQ